MITGAPKGVIFHIEGSGVAVHLSTAAEGLVIATLIVPWVTTIQHLCSVGIR